MTRLAAFGTTAFGTTTLDSDPQIVIRSGMHPERRLGGLTHTDARVQGTNCWPRKPEFGGNHGRG